MKKIFYSAIVCLAMAGCTKDSFVSNFDSKPEERMAASIQEVKTILTSAPDGWVATLPTNTGGGYGFYMTFNTDDQVSMQADLTDNSATTPKASTYRVTIGLGANLIFDTYNYISQLADPDDGALISGTKGKGLGSDVQFTYVRSTADSIIFVGKTNRQTLALVKATAAQKAAYTTANGYKTAIDKIKTFFETISNPYIEVATGATTQMVAVDVDVTNALTTGKRITFAAVMPDGVTVNAAKQKFAFSTEGMTILNGGLAWQGITFVSFKWKDATTLAIYDSTGKEYIINSAPAAIIPLPNFLNTFGIYSSNKAYYTITVLDASKSSNFQPTWDAIKAEFTAVRGTLVVMQLVWQETGGDDVLQIRLYNSATGYYRLNLGVDIDANGITKFRYVSASSSNAARSYFKQVEKFFTGTYPGDPSPSAQPKFAWAWKDARYLSNSFGGLYVVDDNGNKTGVSLIGKVSKGTIFTAW